MMIMKINQKIKKRPIILEDMKQKNMLDFEIKKNKEFENIKKCLNLLILMLMF